MVPRGGMGRRSSCHPGGMGMGVVPSVHANRRASTRSEGVGLFPGLIGGGSTKGQKVCNFYLTLCMFRSKT